MNRLITGDVWPTIQEVLVGRKMAAIGYVGVRAYEILRLGTGDEIVVDGSEKAVKSGSTHPSGVQGWLEAGARVYSIQGLHAKAIWSEGPPVTSIVGSANVSDNSRKLIEASVLSVDDQLCQQVRAEIEDLITQAKGDGPLDEQWVERMQSLVPVRRPQPFVEGPRLPKLVPSKMWIFVSDYVNRTDSAAVNVAEARARERYGSTHVITSFGILKSDPRNEKLNIGDELLLILPSTLDADADDDSDVEPPHRITAKVSSKSRSGRDVLILVRPDLKNLKLGALRRALHLGSNNWAVNEDLLRGAQLTAVRHMW